MTIGLYDTFANPQGCYIIREALYRTFHLAPAGCHLVCNLAKKNSLLLWSSTESLCFVWAKEHRTQTCFDMEEPHSGKDDIIIHGGNSILVLPIFALTRLARGILVLDLVNFVFSYFIVSPYQGEVGAIFTQICNHQTCLQPFHT